jgi:uncharacterized membrane protein
MKRLIISLCLVAFLVSGCVTTWNPSYNVIFNELSNAIFPGEDKEAEK